MRSIRKRGQKKERKPEIRSSHRIAVPLLANADSVLFSISYSIIIIFIVIIIIIIITIIIITINSIHY